MDEVDEIHGEKGATKQVITFFVTAETGILQHDKVPFFPHFP
jgi:hypothetical protein